MTDKWELKHIIDELSFINHEAFMMSVSDDYRRRQAKLESIDNLIRALKEYLQEAR
ncbi:MAG: hypothetical protein GX838_06835 [Clostridiaceae bacterium]|nr:hypothetical protein [Clostridiaceae bacterium]